MLWMSMQSMQINNTSVCGFYTTLYYLNTEACHPLRRESYCIGAFCNVGLVVHQSDEAASFMQSFWDLLLKTGDYREDIQPTSNS